MNKFHALCPLCGAQRPDLMPLQHTIPFIARHKVPWQSDRINLSLFFCCFLILALASCATRGQIASKPIDFSQFRDKPIPADVSGWLECGKQSEITPAISAIASQIRGQNRRESLYKAIDYIHENFIYDNWYSDKAFTRTADELFKSKVLGGCSNYALVAVTLFRALEIPASMVLTANVDWMLAYRENNLLIPTGHVFIEAYLEDRWCLVDPTYRIVFTDYDPASPDYPRREHFCLRAKDYWESGITDVSKLNEIMGTDYGDRHTSRILNR